jgi:hypothetical protein
VQTINLEKRGGCTLTSEHTSSGEADARGPPVIAATRPAEPSKRFLRQVSKETAQPLVTRMREQPFRGALLYDPPLIEEYHSICNASRE